MHLLEQNWCKNVTWDKTFLTWSKRNQEWKKSRNKLFVITVILTFLEEGRRGEVKTNAELAPTKLIKKRTCAVFMFLHNDYGIKTLHNVELLSVEKYCRLTGYVFIIQVSAALITMKIITKTWRIKVNGWYQSIKHITHFLWRPRSRSQEIRSWRKTWFYFAEINGPYFFWVSVSNFFITPTDSVIYQRFIIIYVRDLEWIIALHPLYLSQYFWSLN